LRWGISGRAVEPTVHPTEEAAVRAVNRKPKRQAAMLGLAFDAEDGHKRITKGDNFLLCGGSQETHAVMQETAVKINENLDRQGKKLEDVSIRELRKITREVWEQMGRSGE
jgi:hypothetical protein